MENKFKFLSSFGEIKFLILILIIFFTLLDPGYAQQDTIIKENYLNICTLMVNYETYEFEGGNIAYYPRYLSDQTDSLPFKVCLDPPVDAGRISYLIKDTHDTIFDAFITWMGNTDIIYPDTYSVEQPFLNSTSQTGKPDLIEYFGPYGNPLNNSFYIARADSAWLSVDSLEIVKLFAQKNYKTGIFLLLNDYCIFNPSKTKWVIFLYYNNTAYSIKEPEKLRIKISPNPFKDKINIDFLGQTYQSSNISLISISGQTVFRKELDHICETSINTENIPAGIYLLRINADSFTHNQIIIKN